MSLGDDFVKFIEKVDAKTRKVFVGVVAETQRSVQFGSEITASPGQPVDKGTLRASWTTDFESPESALVATNIEYAPPIEDGIGPHGPLTLRSQVGGFHSVKLTIAGMPLIVEKVTKDVGND